MFIAVLVVLLLAGTGILLSTNRRRKHSRRNQLKQRLRNITFHDQAKDDRLVSFEREELKRKGRPEESIEDRMERAVSRWERDNAAADPVY